MKWGNTAFNCFDHSFIAQGVVDEKIADKTRSTERTFLISNASYDTRCKVAGNILRTLYAGRGVISQIPVASTMAVAKEFIDGRKDWSLFLQHDGPIVLEEYPIPKPFATRPDSFLMDQLQFAFGTMTALINQRYDHEITTLLLTQELFTGSSSRIFLAYFLEHSKRWTRIDYEAPRKAA